MYQTSAVHRPKRLWFFQYPSILWCKQSDSLLQPGGVEQWNGLQNTALTPNTALQLHQLLTPMYKATCPLKQTVRYEETINPEGEGGKKRQEEKKKWKKAHLTVVYHTCLHGHLLWLGPKVKHYGKYLFSASAISGSASTHCFTIQIMGCYLSLLRHKTSQNLEQNQNLKFLKLLLVSSLVFNHRMFNFEESLDYWRPHPYRTLYGCTHQFQTHQPRSET